MLVSILIPTRNRLQYLRLSVASALAQQGVEIEVLVSDDGSSDGSRQFVESVAASDPRVRLLVDNPTPGVFENVEHLMTSSRGDAFTVLGDDDLLDADFCRRLSQPMERDGSVILTFSDHRTIDHDGHLLSRATREMSKLNGRASLPDGPLAQPELAALRGAIWLGFAVYRASAFRGEGFDYSCGNAADWDYAIRAAQRGRISYVSAMLGSYRDHRNTASRRGLGNRTEIALRVLTKHQMQDPEAELKRLEMLKLTAKQNAYHMAAVDRAASLRSMALYASLGGGGSAPHVLAARLILKLPRPVGVWAHGLISGISSAARRGRALLRHA